MSRRAESIGNKARRPDARGGLADAVARACAEAGGVRAVVEATGIKKSRLYEAADPDGEKGLSLREAMEITERCGVSAFAEHLSAKAGGYFMAVEPPAHKTPAQCRADLAEAVSGLIAAPPTRAGLERLIRKAAALAAALPDDGAAP